MRIVQLALFIPLVWITGLQQEAQAQKQLQFDSVIVIAWSGGSSSTYTVPNGKTWKIESGGMNGDSKLYIEDLNGVNRNIEIAFKSTGGGEVGHANIFPIWLTQNTTISFNTGTSQAFVSILQFDVN